MKLAEKLQAIQSEFKAPKSQYNSFGKYKYRSAEDILEALKPIQAKYKVYFVVEDQLKELGGHLFVDCTASINDVENDESIEVTAQAIIDFQAKGMQMPQRTGAASSYAKKYALGNLLLIDDTKDADATNDYKETKTAPKKTVTVLTDENINSSIAKGKQAGLLDLIAAGKFSATKEQIERLKK